MCLQVRNIFNSPSTWTIAFVAISVYSGVSVASWLGWPFEKCPLTHSSKTTLIKQNCLDQCWARLRILKNPLVNKSFSSLCCVILHQMIKKCLLSSPTCQVLTCSHCHRMVISSFHMTDWETKESFAEMGALHPQLRSGSVPCENRSTKLVQIKWALF